MLYQLVDVNGRDVVPATTLSNLVDIITGEEFSAMRLKTFDPTWEHRDDVVAIHVLLNGSELFFMDPEASRLFLNDLLRVLEDTHTGP